MYVRGILNEGTDEDYLGYFSLRRDTFHNIVLPKFKLFWDYSSVRTRTGAWFPRCVIVVLVDDFC